ncbi:aldo/keto reductase [Ktedonospora formicarum]|uniref:Oxidoreductase n=1 Tax=Ktedonospora formicarum TaxID=2778364 RepID=A0A8J3MPQ6_9CHLR|nr:aldo/keto reductase [Ktedonospora formicarum]GHO42011.1 oxidoreductase [Ktedonospora formicarum]
MQNIQQNPAHASGTLTLGGDLKVYRLGFGAMRITGEGIWGPPANKQEAIALLRRTLELGINLIDTADSYGPNVSEELIAEALFPYPEGLVIATKGGLLRTGPGRWPLDGRPEHLREALEGSLRRLRVDHIDLYQFHRPDPKVPFEDSVGEIAKMQQEGKIRHVGLSNVTIDELARAQKIVSIVTVQNHYNLSKRESERMTAQQSEEMIDICARQGIGFIPWNPLSTGALARPGSKLDQVAKKHNAQSSQIALAWLLHRSPTLLPIPGTSSIKHLEENVLGATIELSQEEFDAINQGASKFSTSQTSLFIPMPF